MEALAVQDYAGAWEIIVADGGSEDGTLAAVERFSTPTTLVATRGVSRQRNAGARVAMGELLVFMDADDRPHPQFLALVAASYRRWPFAVACPWFVARDAGWFVRLIYCAFNLAFLAGQSTLRMGSGVCLICPREAFLRIGGFDESLHLGEDIQLIRRLCPRHGFHRHLLIPLETSGRRFAHHGTLRLLAFYARITPLLLLGLWQPLQRYCYEAAPYKSGMGNG
jgi:glycosyltransferase involved in cell wall biosynthesis